MHSQQHWALQRWRQHMVQQHSSGVRYSTVATDSRRWCTAILETTPGHVVALCAEDGSGDSCCSADDCNGW